MAKKDKFSLQKHTYNRRSLTIPHLSTFLNNFKDILQVWESFANFNTCNFPSCNGSYWFVCLKQTNKQKKIYAGITAIQRCTTKYLFLKIFGVLYAIKLTPLLKLLVEFSKTLKFENYFQIASGYFQNCFVLRDRLFSDWKTNSCKNQYLKAQQSTTSF